MTNFNLKHAVIAGVIAGTISGLVKLGWENIVPPRTPERDKTNPPQQFLENLGVPASVTHSTYTYSGHDLPWVSYTVHFGFSIGLATLYSVSKHYVPLLKLGQGTAYGLGVWSVAHLLAMPALSTIPDAADQPLAEHVSEALGHATWMWVNDQLGDQVYRQLEQK